MNAVAASLGTRSLLWGGRVRGLLAGLGYVTTVTLAIILTWSMLGALEGGLGSDLQSAIRNFGMSMLVNVGATFPTLPIVVIVANLAPRSGVMRYLWLGGAAASMVLWCLVYGLLLLGSTESPWAYVEASIQAFLTVAACAYRSSARTATSALLRNEIEGAALDSEVKRARLQLLRAQIEPHFLFNTLATVRTLARIDRPAAVEMIDNLMRYLAEALPRLRAEESSLAEELELIDAYLRIHQIRMGSRLAYELSAPAELRGVRIPTMMLLTLVENALKHGINPALEGGHIRVSAARDHSSLVLRVADTGRGMTAQEGHGTGLANIRLRLTMLYGQQAMLSLARAESRGVIATISIPMAKAS